LLENALGGDSNICVICTLSAEEAHCSETLETLKFAGRCSQVETRAKKNVVSLILLIERPAVDPLAAVKRQGIDAGEGPGDRGVEAALAWIEELSSFRRGEPHSQLLLVLG
jgi:hypothetical protein